MASRKELVDRMLALGLSPEDYFMKTDIDLRDIEEAIVLPLESSNAEYDEFAHSLRAFSTQCRRSDLSAAGLSQFDLLRRTCIEREIRRWQPSYSPERKRHGKVMETVIIDSFAVSITAECNCFNSEHVVVLTPDECSQWLSGNLSEMQTCYPAWWWVERWELIECLPLKSLWRRTKPKGIADDRLWFVHGNSSFRGHGSSYGVWWEHDGIAVRFIQVAPQPSFT